MGKCMPASALPRAHPNHPSGLYFFYIARKEIKDQLADTKTNLKNLYGTEEEIIESIDWTREGLHQLGSEAEYRSVVASSLLDVFTVRSQSFITMRCLQQEVNRMRKLLAQHDAEHICCCRIKHFIKEVLALSDLIELELMTAFESSSSAIDEDLEDMDDVDNFWNKVNTMDNLELRSKDETLAILKEIKQSPRQPRSRYDCFELLFAHLGKVSSMDELDRFDSTIMSYVLNHIVLYRYLFCCILAVSDGNSCTECSDCGEMDCGLHGFMSRSGYYGPEIFHVQDPNFVYLSEMVATQLISNNLPKIVNPRQLWDAMIRWCEESCILHSLLEEAEGRSRVLLANDQREQVQALLCSQDHGFAQTPTVLRELFDFLRTLSEASTRPAIDANKATSLNENDISTAKHWTSTNPMSADSGDIDTSDTWVANKADQDAEAQDCTIKDQLRVFSTSRQRPKLITHRQTKVTITPRNGILSKYQKRGYGKLTTYEAGRSAMVKRINKPMWMVDNPTLYHDVWRVIFPLTKEHRQVTRVSWRLFKQAIESPPVDCRLKKAQDPIFVWERTNENGGKDIFQCHAPHSLDWIPGSDLYRYRKDLRDIFDMDADRIRLRGKVYEANNHVCGSIC